MQTPHLLVGPTILWFVFGTSITQASLAKRTEELEDAQAAIDDEHDRLEALQEDMEKRRAELTAQVGSHW